MAIETFAPQAGATPLRIRRVQKITLTLLFIAGIVNFLDRSSLSVAGEAIRADLGLSATEFGVLLSAFSLSYGFAQLLSLIHIWVLSPAACGTAAAALRSVKGRGSPPAASAREPRAVDLSNARRVTPPEDS